VEVTSTERRAQLKIRDAVALLEIQTWPSNGIKGWFQECEGYEGHVVQLSAKSARSLVLSVGDQLLSTRPAMTETIYHHKSQQGPLIRTETWDELNDLHGIKVMNSE